jgi:integrase
MNGPQKWKVAYCTSLTHQSHDCGPGEIRNLRRKDVDLRNRVLHIREGAKNEFRVRDIPLNDEAFWAVSELHARAVKLGAIDPDHYLLPARAPRQGDSAAVTLFLASSPGCKSGCVSKRV